MARKKEKRKNNAKQKLDKKNKKTKKKINIKAKIYERFESFKTLKKNRKLVFSSVILFIIFIITVGIYAFSISAFQTGIDFFRELPNEKKTIQKNLQNNLDKKEGRKSVARSSHLGSYAYFQIQGPHGKWYGNGGIVAFTNMNEPYVDLYSGSGKKEVRIYEADYETLLDYLVHVREGQTSEYRPDIEKLPLLETKTLNFQPKQLSANSQSSSKLDLPGEESRILLVGIEIGVHTVYFFTVFSDFGVTVKEGKDELIFWGQSFKDLRSIEGGEITVYNLKDEIDVIATTSFDSEGIALMPLNSLADIAVIEYQDSVTILPINFRNIDQQWGMQNRFFPNEELIRYFLFTDRPLYRPGDELYFKSIIRDDLDARYTVGGGIYDVTLYRDDKLRRFSIGSTIIKKSFKLSSYGSIDGKIDLPEDLRPGTYVLKIGRSIEDLPANKSRWSSSGGEQYVRFDVEKFRKAEYSLSVDTETNEYIVGDEIKYKISGNYVSGLPLAYKKVNYKLYVYDYIDVRYDEKRFDNMYRDRVVKSDIRDSGVVQLNDKGEVILSIKTGTDLSKNQVYSIEVNFQDEGAEPVMDRKNVLVYSAEYGIYREDNRWYNIDVGSNYQLPVILISRRGGNVLGIDLTASVKRINRVKAKREDGSCCINRDEEVYLPDIKGITDSEGKVMFDIPTMHEGRYVITVYGKDNIGNPISNKFEIKTRLALQVNNIIGDSSLVLTTGIDKVKPGDKLNINIDSEHIYRDVLLTFERDFVYRYKVISLNEQSKSVEEVIENLDIPNIIIGASSFSYTKYDSSQKEIHVSADSKKIDTEISFDREKYGPGDYVTINLEAKDGEGLPVVAEFALSAVDKSLYELVSEEPKDIFDAFWKFRYHGTYHSDSLKGISAIRTEPSEMGSAGCFAENTEILLSGGTKKYIQDISVGDKLLTRNDKSDGLLEVQVVEKWEHIVNGYLIINEHLKVTPEHVMYVNGKWLEAGTIQLDDVLMDTNGNSVQVKSLEWQSGKFRVYNFETSGNHTYIANDIWVHNEKGRNYPARSNFKDVAYWNANVRTDSAGQASARFKIPDNLTTWVVSAVGAAKDTKVGTARSEFHVSKEVIVRPIAPNVLTEGDEIILSSMVQNYTDEAHAFSTQLKFDAGEALLTRPGYRFIGANEMEHEYWYVKAKKPFGNAKLTFSATTESDLRLNDTVVKTVDVRPLGYKHETVLTRFGDESYTVDLFDDSDLNRTSIRLSIAPSAVGTIQQAAKHLVQYPYGSVEQTTGRFVPSIIAKSEPDIFGDAFAGKDIDDILKQSISRLAKLQNSDGSWASHYRGSSPFFTAYVVEYIDLAEKEGVEVDPQILEDAKLYFTNLQKENDGNLVYMPHFEKLNIIIAYGMSILDLENTQPIEISNDMREPDLVALATLANIRRGKMDKKKNGINLLKSLAKKSGGEIYWERGEYNTFGSVNGSTALAIRALIAAKEDKEIISKAALYLAKNRSEGYWTSSFGTAQAMNALSQYAHYISETNPNITYSLKLDGRVIDSGFVDTGRQYIKDIIIPASSIKNDGSILDLSFTGDREIFSILVVDEFRTDIDSAEESNNLFLDRKYINETNPDQSFRVGDVVRIELGVGGLRQGDNYLVVEDFLPSGFVPINTSFNTYHEDKKSDWWSYEPTQFTENGAIFTNRYLGDKGESFEYKARVISEGRFMAPPARAELMYKQEKNARTSFDEIRTSQFVK